MDVFENAFNRKRNTNYKRNERQLSEVGKMLNQEIPPYLFFYKSAVDSYDKWDFQNALVFIKKTIEHSDIDDWRQFAFKANVLEDLQNYKEAIETYETSIDIKGDDVGAYALYHQIGFCYSVISDYQNAVKFFSLALDLKKQHSNSEFNPDREGMNMGVMVGISYEKIYNNRANALKNLNRLNEAFEDCKKAISYDSQYSNPYLLLALIFSQTGQEDKAIEMLEHSAKLGNQEAIRILNKIK